MSEPAQSPSPRNNFRDEISSTFRELIATEVTTRTDCDPRGPRVAVVSTTQRIEVRMVASSRQFILQDQEECDCENLLWTERQENDLIAFGKAIVGIGTVENLTIIPIVVEVHDRPATAEELDIATASRFWDHIAEGSMKLRSGRLGVTNTEIGFKTPIEIRTFPGRYRVRAYYGALDHRRGEEDNDLIAVRPDDGRSHYLVRLWPTDRKLRRCVLRRWHPAVSQPPAEPLQAGVGPTERPETVIAPASVRVTEPLAADLPSGGVRPTSSSGSEPVDGECVASVQDATWYEARRRNRKPPGCLRTRPVPQPEISAEPGAEPFQTSLPGLLVERLRPAIDRVPVLPGPVGDELSVDAALVGAIDPSISSGACIPPSP